MQLNDSALTMHMDALVCSCLPDKVTRAATVYHQGIVNVIPFGSLQHPLASQAHMKATHDVKCAFPCNARPNVDKVPKI